MSLYPSLEDMKVDQLTKAQQHLDSQFSHPYGVAPSHPAASYPSAPHYPTLPSTGGPSPALPYPVTPSHALAVYPTLSNYMGLDLTPEIIAANMPDHVGTVAVQPPRDVSRPQTGMIAPITSMTLGLQKAQVTHGIRELMVCKDASGKVGLRVSAINRGVFVCLVMKDSPAALAGLRFGDQLLQVNGEVLAGYTQEQVHKIFKKSAVNNISIIVRDRPFERTITLHKDSVGHVGFHFKDGEIIRLVKDSSAARNGLLTEHHLLEVDGQNVVGLKDKEISAIINNTPAVITITVIPSFVYKHMMTKMSGNLVKAAMDHSIPTL